MARTPSAALALLLALAPVALPAQEAEPSLGEEGRNLLEEGADLFLRSLREQVEPAVEEIAGIGAELLPTFQLLAQEMGPALAEVIGQVDSIGNYEPPAFLPNGDIILRRSPDAPAWTPPEPEAER
jgi:hypothetical protein